MRRIKCRFRNLDDLNLFSKRINIPLTERTHTCYVDYKYTEEKDAPPLINGVPKWWSDSWVDMYEFNVDYKEECEVVIDFIFSEKYTPTILTKLFAQNITEKSSFIWFPKLDRDYISSFRVISPPVEPKYPIYIVSKNRAVNEPWHTSYRLTQSGIKHYIVVEPDQVDMYKEVFNNPYTTILEMDMTYKDTYDCFSDLGNINSTGPGAARNFCWEHSIQNGFKWHFVLDDNVAGFRMFFRGKKLQARTGEIFRSLERFADRYDNLYISGLNYSNFCRQQHKTNAYVLNTRIYSLLFIRNDIPYRWRGRYNEDTDLSLRVLKDGFCTAQFNLFTGDKVVTQAKAGGNSEEFYFHEGTTPKSQMLQQMHPDCVKLVEKFGRPHHEVNYKVFKNKLHLDAVQLDENYIVPDIWVVKVPKGILADPSKDTAEYLWNHRYDFERVDNTNIWLP